MSKTYAYNNFLVTTVDIKTVYHNRGTIPTSVPNQIQIAPSPGGSTGNITASRVISGNHIDICKPGASYKNAKNINAIHDNHAYVYVSGYNWKQYRTLVAGQSYAFVPTRDTHSVFQNNAGTSATLTLDLNAVGILPGMKFALEAHGAGTAILTITNGTIINPATGATGTTVTVSQYGYAVIRLIGDASAGGAKLFIEDALGAVVS